ncbi:hypothetical protein EVA_20901, partial [gut metagenome]
LPTGRNYLSTVLLGSKGTEQDGWSVIT